MIGFDNIKLFELNKTSNKYEMILYKAKKGKNLKLEITKDEYDRLYNKYDYFIDSQKGEKVVFIQDFSKTKENMFYHLRKEFAREFSTMFI